MTPLPDTSVQTVLGLDIGGANLKAAHSDGWVRSHPFALWQAPDKLAERLATLGAEAGDFDAIALTMTAELCDCFETKRQGVSHVLRATAALAGGRPIYVWGTDRRWLTVEEARSSPMTVAAANWHALATWTARQLSPGERSVLIDMGSTTTDIIPLTGTTGVATKARTDTQRLASGELLYLGAGRTPLMAVASVVPWRGRQYHVMAEHFADMRDALTLLGDANAEASPSSRDDTADGRSRSREHCAARVLRMVGGDLDSHSMGDAKALARSLADAARERLRRAVQRVIAKHEASSAVIGGSGAGVALAWLDDLLPRVVMLEDVLGRDLDGATFGDSPGDASAAACAVALVLLWHSQETLA